MEGWNLDILRPSPILLFSTVTKLRGLIEWILSRIINDTNTSYLFAAMMRSQGKGDALAPLASGIWISGLFFVIFRTMSECSIHTLSENYRDS